MKSLLSRWILNTGGETYCIFLPFYVLGFGFLLILLPVAYVIGVLLGFLSGLRCVYVGIKKDSFLLGLLEVGNVVYEADKVRWNEEHQLQLHSNCPCRHQKCAPV